MERRVGEMKSEVYDIKRKFMHDAKIMLKAMLIQVIV